MLETIKQKYGKNCVICDQEADSVGCRVTDKGTDMAPVCIQCCQNFSDDDYVTKLDKYFDDRALQDFSRSADVVN